MLPLANQMLDYIRLLLWFSNTDSKAEMCLTCVPATEMHVCDGRPLVQLRVIHLDTLPHQRAVVPTHSV